jgi:predicted nucleic acid-binding protein
VIVVDTNVVAYLYLESEFTARAELQLRLDPDWAAPPLWRSEFRNILAGAVRRRTLAFDDALRITAEAESLLAGGEYPVSTPEVLELVRQSDCSAYDCEFAALALQLGIPLVTMDAKLLKAFPRVAAALPRTPG